MSYDEHVLAHMKWKARLKNHLNGHEHIDNGTLAKDNLCELGKWIYGDGQRHAKVRAFEDLKARHTKFHLVAASVASNAMSYSPDKVKELLDPMKSEFGRATSDVINALSNAKSLLE